MKDWTITVNALDETKEVQITFDQQNTSEFLTVALDAEQTESFIKHLQTYLEKIK